METTNYANFNEYSLIFYQQKLAFIRLHSFY